MKPELSILIPAYNYNTYPLVQALHKQAEQTTILFEILVFDDASQLHIETNNNINEFTNATYQYFDINRGRSAIRNELAVNAKYEKLLFLDADMLPVDDDFINRYITHFKFEFDVICGGIAYKDIPPEPNKQLRYVYGKNREAKDAKTRQKNQYIIVFANLLIHKDCFLKINTTLDNFYGGDLLLSQNLMRQKATVKHIDNPACHLGLESSLEYMIKSKQAITNMVRMEKEGKIHDDIIPLQKMYKKIKRIGLIPLYRFTVSLLNTYLESNLTSKNPSLLLFDIYRLKYYSDQKRHA